MPEQDDDIDYRGPASLRTGDTELQVTVVLRGHFQPLDGRYHWYGRVDASAAVAELADGRSTQVELRTPQGSATGKLSDPDPWSRYRVTGVGRPPFALAHLD